MVTDALPDLAARVREVFLRCLFTADELDHGRPVVEVEGIVTNVGFHPDRLEASRAEVLALLEAIVRPEFWVDGGGGYSFLYLVLDVAGAQWAEHRNAEELYLLAAGLGHAAFLMPREHWALLPGAMPYLVFRRTPEGSPR